MPDRNAILAALLTCGLLPLGCGPSERGEGSGGSKASPAEQLFRDFEAKILSAKVVRATGTWASKGGKGGGETRARFLSGPENQLRMTAVAKSDERDPNVGLVSDGTVFHRITGDGRKGAKLSLPKGLGQGVRSGFSRIGLSVVPFALKDEFRLDLQHFAAWFPVGDFALLRDEVIGGRTARVLQFSSGPKNTKFLFTLYLDAETLRPLKRLWEAGDGAVVTETYEEFELDGPADEKEFRIPD
jgi:hypothetical protein